MNHAEEPKAWQQAIVLAQQALNCKSPEDLERWTIEYLESINDTFF